MIFFISDLHLSPNRPEITRAFYQFLDSTASQAEHLYILGDFFDAWVGDDDDTAEFREIEQALARFNQKQQRVSFMHGNRDFMIGEEFCKRTGVCLLAEPTCIDLYGKPTLLLHGDSLCTLDQEYMAFRKQVRDPQWQTEVMKRSLAERKAIAAQMQSTSKSMNSLKAEDIMDVTPEEVVKVMQENNTQLLIHGHTHRPKRHALTFANDNNPEGKSAERIVLGDWHDLGWYLQVDESNLSLKSFTISL